MIWSAGRQLSKCEGLNRTSASLNSVSAFPNHSTNRTAQHVGDETLEEGLLREIFVVLLKVLFRRCA